MSDVQVYTTEADLTTFELHDEDQNGLTRLDLTDNDGNEFTTFLSADDRANLAVMLDPDALSFFNHG